MRVELFLCAVASLVLMLAGCSGQPPVQETSCENLGTIGNAYVQATERQGKPPAGPDELKPFLPADASFEQLNKSPNDGEPFVILWGADPRQLRDIKPGVIGYEKNGKDGKRFVFTAMGLVTMSDEDFSQANFPPGHSAPK